MILDVPNPIIYGLIGTITGGIVGQLLTDFFGMPVNVWLVTLGGFMGVVYGIGEWVKNAFTVGVRNDGFR